MTNFEKIKSMSLVEMAAFLECDVWEDEDYNKVLRTPENPRGSKTTCCNIREIQRWLKREWNENEVSE